MPGHQPHSPSCLLASEEGGKVVEMTSKMTVPETNSMGGNLAEKQGEKKIDWQ